MLSMMSQLVRKSQPCVQKLKLLLPGMVSSLLLDCCNSWHDGCSCVVCPCVPDRQHCCTRSGASVSMPMP